MGVEAEAHPQRGSGLRHRLRSARICSAWRRSTRSVILKFSGEPSTTATRPPRASTSEASSVAPKQDLVGLRVGVHQHLPAEDLRSLRPPERPPVGSAL